MAPAARARALRCLRRFERRAVAGIALLALGAGEAETLTVVCPLLDSEDTAALSARLRADLGVRGASGRFSVTCNESGAVTRWMPADGPAQEEETLLAAGEKLTVERLLEVADRLLARQPAAPQQSAAPQAPEPQAAPVQPAQAQRALANDEPSAGAAAPAPDRVEPPLAHPEAATFGVLLGIEGERWSSDLSGAVGPRGGPFVRLQPGLMLSVTGGARWAIAPPDDLRARTVDAFAYADVRVVSWLMVGGGLGVTYLAVRSSDELGALDDAAWSPAIELRGRANLGAGAWRAWASPFARLRPGPTIAELNGQEAFRIPALTVGVALDASLDLVALD